MGLGLCRKPDDIFLVSCCESPGVDLLVCSAAGCLSFVSMAGSDSPSNPAALGSWSIDDIALCRINDGLIVETSGTLGHFRIATASGVEIGAVLARWVHSEVSAIELRFSTATALAWGPEPMRGQYECARSIWVPTLAAAED